MKKNSKSAPGWPGRPARWTSSAKSGIGTAISSNSRLWFTISHGIFNEIYFPTVDQANIRDMGLIVTDGKNFFSEEKRHTQHEVNYISDGVLGYSLVNTCNQGRYRIEKRIITDPFRETVLQWTRFTPLKGHLEDYHLYVLLAPHLANRGSGNTGWTGNHKGTPMLFAARANNTLALACSTGWKKRSIGFVGTTDGWQDLVRHKVMTWEYNIAKNGNVALTGEIDISSGKGEFLLALGFGVNKAEAGLRTRTSLFDGFEHAQDEYTRQWEEWQKTLLPLEVLTPTERDLFRTSMMVIKAHEAKAFLGGMIASLSIPWGFVKGDDDLGGYHLVWPRDLMESAGGYLAGGGKGDSDRVLHYLRSTQEEDGRWPQNMWINSTAYWDCVQLDEAALPILLIDLVEREGSFRSGISATDLWPMVKRAAAYIVKNGPVTEQDRWEEAAGYTPFTLAAEIAGLLAAADIADRVNQSAIGSYLRETADYWNECIEDWIYARDTDMARKYGVDGYYIRIAPPLLEAGQESPLQGCFKIVNRKGYPLVPVVEIVSPDALALVRFGLRAPEDPRITNTIKLIDDMLKVDTPFGPAWHRYNDDGYGEHEDGAPFDGTGIGRIWPLLTGERAHYELAAGRPESAGELMRAMERFANEGGMIPEQVWDTHDIPERGLSFGRPSGSAMPLVWAHAEYVKLRRSLHEGKVFDLPTQTVERYILHKKTAAVYIWRFNDQRKTIPFGKMFRIETLAHARIRWGLNQWKDIVDTESRDSGLGIFLTDLPTADLPKGSLINFTFYWPEAKKWEEKNFEVKIV